MKTLKNGLQTHSGASLRSCCSVDTDTWCKQALSVGVRLNWRESDVAARWVHRKSDLMFTLSSDEYPRKIFVTEINCNVLVVNENELTT